MADFRRLLYVFAAVAFLTSLTVPAYADFTCTGTSDNRPTRAESFNDLGGNIVLTCSGGTGALQPIAAGSVIPPTTITVTSNTNITSRILATFTVGVKTQFNEALLMLDEPNTTTSLGGNGHILSNCGFNGEDSDPASGPGVCQIKGVGAALAATQYDGLYTGCATGTFGCGHPNVFQGRVANSLVGGEFNKIQFVGVPLDPPNSAGTRIIRINNVRIDGTKFGAASPFSTVPVTATVSFAGYINIPSVTVQFATVELGMTNTVFEGRGLLQCVGTDDEVGTTDSDDKGNIDPFFSGSGGLSPAGKTSPTGGMDIRVIENFSTAWRVRNVKQITDNGTIAITGAFVCATGIGAPCDASGVGGAIDSSDITEPAPVFSSKDDVQNVPGVNYNTESGFENCGGVASANCSGGVPNITPSPNPPEGYGSPVLPGFANPFQETVGPTGIETAGQATQGTRIAIQIGSIPKGARLFFPLNVLLQNQSDASVTGVMSIDASADQAGSGGFKFATPTSVSFTPSGGSSAVTLTNTHWREVKASAPVVTYEILFTRADALEYADIVPAVVFNNNGLSTDLPQASVAATASVSFAPICSDPACNQPNDDTFDTPRFISGFKTPGDALSIIDKCACNLLFPWVVSAGNIDTGIVVANTSLDPCAGAPCTVPGFGPALPQNGVVTFYYFGTVGVGDHNPVANLTPNVSLPVLAGGYVAHVLSQNTSATNGLGSRSNFAGYVIAQANFQWCHGVVDITLGSAVIFNYVGLQLDIGDDGGLHRTGLPGEVTGH